MEGFILQPISALLGSWAEQKKKPQLACSKMLVLHSSKSGIQMTFALRFGNLGEGEIYYVYGVLGWFLGGVQWFDKGI